MEMIKELYNAAKSFRLFVYAQQTPTTTAQAVDVKAVVAGALGLVKKGSDYEFDTNSKVADIIFNAMDANDWKGKIVVNLAVDSKKVGKLTVTASPNDQKGQAIANTVNSKLNPGVNAALKASKLNIADTISIPEIVSAWNQ